MTVTVDSGDKKMPKFPFLSIRIGCRESSSIPKSMSISPENLDSGHVVVGENSCLICSEMLTAAMLVMLSTTYALTWATVPSACRISSTTYSEFKESVCPNDSTISVFFSESILSSSTSLLDTIVQVLPLSKKMLVDCFFLSLPVTTVISWIMRRILSPSKSGECSNFVAAIISSSLVSSLAAFTHSPRVVDSPESLIFPACCGNDLAWKPLCEYCLWVDDP